MDIFDIFEAWSRLIENSTDASGVIARFNRSPIDRPNRSCNLNLRRNDQEIDLLVWESGEAELVVGLVDGSVSQIHFDDLRNKIDLATIFSAFLEFMSSK